MSGPLGLLHWEFEPVPLDAANSYSTLGTSHSYPRGDDITVCVKIKILANPLKNEDEATPDNSKKKAAAEHPDDSKKKAAAEHPDDSKEDAAAAEHSEQLRASLCKKVKMWLKKCFG